MKSLTFISSNVNKVQEVIKLLENVPNLKLVSENINLPEYQGEMIEICKLKAKDGYRNVNKPVLVEDTSLCFNALNGMPGPYIKWFMRSTDHQKIEVLNALRKMLIGFNNFNAEAISVFCFYDHVFCQEPISFVGTSYGRIVEPRGSLVFDWDACFEPLEQDESFCDSPRTYSQMDKSYKNRISHRSKALKKFKDFLQNEYLVKI